MRVLCCCVLALVLGVTSAVGQEKKIKRSDLPPAVERTVAAQSQGATIRGFSQEEEKGQIYYEAELLVVRFLNSIAIPAVVPYAIAIPRLGGHWRCPLSVDVPG